MSKNHHTERGQLLVILAIGLVGLLGFTALAIDGGMVFSDRRKAQNAADTAAMAGGWATLQSLESQNIFSEDFGICSPTQVQNPMVRVAMDAAYNPAKLRATSNGYDDLITGVDTKNGVEVTCYSGTESDQYGHKGNHIDVHVMITKPTQTALIQFVYSGPVVNTVEAVVRVQPKSTLGNGAAISSTSLNCQGPPPFSINSGGVWFKGIGGSNQVLLTGGGVFSNSCLDADGNIYVQVLPTPPPPDSISYITYSSESGNPEYYPEPIKTSPTRLYPPLDLESCGNNITQPKGNKTKTNVLDPGTYLSTGKKDTINIPNGETWVMNPGLYCVDGDFIVKGTLSSGGAIGEGVTIYMRTGDLLISAGATVNLKAPEFSDANWKSSTSYAEHAYNKLLIYGEPSLNYSQSIILGGNGSSSFVGTVYAPSARVDIGGNPKIDTPGYPDDCKLNPDNPECKIAAKYGTSIIGYAIVVHGSAVIEITYDKNTNAVIAGKMDLNK